MIPHLDVHADVDLHVLIDGCVDLHPAALERREAVLRHGHLPELGLPAAHLARHQSIEPRLLHSGRTHVVGHRHLSGGIPDDDSLGKLTNPAIQYLERKCFHDPLLHLIIIDLAKHYQSQLMFQEGKKGM